MDRPANQMGPVIDDALAQSGRQRGDIEVSVWPWMAINEDRKQAIEDTRGTVAFYASAKAYESFFEAHGFLDQARACQNEINLGVDVEPFWQIADSLCPTPPVWGIPQEKSEYHPWRGGQRIENRCMLSAVYSD